MKDQSSQLEASYTANRASTREGGRGREGEGGRECSYLGRAIAKGGHHIMRVLVGTPHYEGSSRDTTL